MSFLRILSLFAMAICGVAALISILVCWILDKPLYMSNSKSRIEKLEKKYGLNDTEENADENTEKNTE